MNFLSKFLSRKTEDMSSTPEVEDTAAVEDVSDRVAMMPERPVYDGSQTYDHGASPYGDTGSSADEIEEFVSTMGTPLDAGITVATDEEIVEAMRTVFDPEIPVNIYDLGLIYTHVTSDKGDVTVEMSLTAPGCPVAGEMPGMVSAAVSNLENIGIVTTTIVWDPPWTTDRMSEDAKLALGMF